MKKIKPCPHCGQDAFLNYAGDDFWVDCHDYCTASSLPQREAEAIERWNRRPALTDAAPALLAALKAIVSSTHPDVRLHPEHVHKARVAIAAAEGKQIGEEAWAPR